MIQPRRASRMLMPVFAMTIVSVGMVYAQGEGEKKPSVSLRASPSAGFSPLKVRLTVELRGGADDFEDFYCPSIEWDFGDDTTSEAASDCDPYQPGRSQIRRRYTTEHVFNYDGEGRYTVRFRMRQGERVVANATTNITVRGNGGFREDFD